MIHFLAVVTWFAVRRTEHSSLVVEIVTIRTSLRRLIDKSPVSRLRRFVHKSSVSCRGWAFVETRQVYTLFLSVNLVTKCSHNL